MSDEKDVYDEKSEQQIVDESNEIKTLPERRPISIIRLICMSCSLAALEVCYAAQAVNEVPILLATGLPQKYIPYLWSLTPILALIIQPYLASVSDHCTCSWGRRRPFILAFAIGIFIGIFFLGFGTAIGHLIDPFNNTVIIILVITGVWFMDYFTDALQVPGKAILLDSSIGYAQTANNISTIVASFGMILGYGICSIHWNSTFFGDLFANEGQAVFTVAAFTSGILFLISFIFGKEKPYTKPVSSANFQNDESHNSDNNEAPPKENQNYGTIREVDSTVIDQQNEDAGQNKLKLCCYGYIYSIVKMPKELVILCALSIFGWIAHNDPRWNTRGCGTDSAILNNCLYLGTFIISITFGPIIQSTNSISVVFITAGTCNLIAAVISVFVVDPENTSLLIDISYETVKTKDVIID
ncbi:uncharacterized protein TRIADDRAFT_56653 [Trichoplax adhaerens]|uniref:Major facilitator superfamily (MFS) profile domain-containing protein n=1 Tax=Trichoplax adhaerens TaxID=10228 RepID=B3RYR8_TRIAD|nr:hypothetical protein TRIADDRAFT_56653 [Trichoplax adhaerens]EDV24642.1 hypothetical protein TRIADDRAFT_56653 [Trichoplax adhaerens]|eukprot:XP_002112532.1 hypothetical protein TRIADDRAFT_56653 [Trichoplax adhaerens]